MKAVLIPSAGAERLWWLPRTVSIGKRVRFNESLKAQSVKPRWQIMQTVELPADTRIAQCLEVSLGDPVVRYERVSSADDIPLSLSSSYFPGALFPGLVAHCQTDWSISSMLQIEYHCDHNSSFHPAVSTAAAGSARAHFADACHQAQLAV
ncbi:MAG: UTRA domain-containing protein [Cyanobacteria bacterium P01_D01_bin.6]